MSTQLESQDVTQSLDGRRPRFLRDFVGNGDIVERLLTQIRQTGGTPRRFFSFAPSGGGKTTLGTILTQRFLCRDAQEDGDACGLCENCSMLDIRKHPECLYWLGQDLEDGWDYWWQTYRSYLLNPNYVFFLDEAQDLTERRQKGLYSILESAEAMIIFATTDKNKVLDALVNRFGTNIYELRRPTEVETINHLKRLAVRLQVTVTDGHLQRAVEYYGRDLRKCVDFVFTARDQNEEGVVTDQFMNSVCRGNAAAVQRSPRRVTEL